MWIKSVCIFLICFASANALRKQGIAVKGMILYENLFERLGKLVCGGVGQSLLPASTNTTKVKIFDVDTGNIFLYLKKI